MIKCVCSNCRDVVNISNMFTEKTLLNYFKENPNDKIFIGEPSYSKDNTRIQYNSLTCRLCGNTEFKMYFKKY